MKRMWACSGILAFVVLVASAFSAAQSEQVLYSFTSADDTPGGVIFDNQGNLYGTTYQGGASGDGTVFKLTPISRGGWRYKQIYSFKVGSDGVRPYGGVVVSPTGIVYGTTWLGGIGTNQCFSNFPGCGTVFELSPNADGSYAHTVIYTFLGPPTDGGASQGPL